MSAAILGDDFVDLKPEGRVRPDATNRGASGRHEDGAQKGTLPRGAASLYLDGLGGAADVGLHEWHTEQPRDFSREFRL